MGEVDAGGLDQFPLRTEPFERHLEKDHRFDPRPSSVGIEIVDPLTDGTQVELRLQVAVEVVRENQILQRNGNGFMEAAALRGTQHRELRGAGRVVRTVDLLLQRRRRSRMFLEIPVERRARDAERLADRGNVRLSSRREGACQLQLLRIGKLLCAPAQAAPRSRRHQPSVGALPNHVALELGLRAEEVEDELAPWRRGADLLGEGLEADPTLGQDGDGLDRVFQRAAEAIEPPDDERRLSVAGQRRPAARLG